MSGCFDDPKEVFERPFCVHAVSKALEGVAEPRDARLQPCDDHECKPLKTVTGLRLATPSYRCDSKFGKLLEKFEAPEFFAAFANLPASRARGVHAAKFDWNGPKLEIIGDMTGTINANTARRPVEKAPATIQCAVNGLIEGHLCGEVVRDETGGLKRARLVGNYRFRVRIDNEKGIVSTLGVGTFEGTLLQWCG